MGNLSAADALNEMNKIYQESLVHQKQLIKA
jgi:hypothetical protein